MVRTVDREAAADAVAAFLRAIGHEPSGELAQTPKLVAEAWCSDLLTGYGQDPAQILSHGSMPCEDASGPVTLRGLSVSTMCPHHLLPAHGTADIVYLPGARIAGFGAIARALHALTRRLTLQETAGAAMAQVVVDALHARGAACRLRLTHTCLTTRGPRETTAVVESLALAGSCGEPGADRTLILGALHR